MRVSRYKSPYVALAADEYLERPTLPYPSGWFCVGLSRDWKPGALRTCRFFGSDVVVYRTVSGMLRVTRPHCPHLGAHLGAGGTVDGEFLVCPLHRFAFGADGACARTPYGAPPRAALELLPSREQYGIVWVWHSVDGSRPTWELPELPEATHPRTVHGKELAGHPQDVMETVIDHRRLVELHGLSSVETLSPPKAVGPFGSVTYRIGRELSRISTVQEVEVKFLGLGGALFLIDLPRLRVAQWLLATPVASGRLQYRAAASVVTDLAPRLPLPVRRVLEKALSFSANRWHVYDARAMLPVLHHKAYVPEPKLTATDAPIGAYRRWARQFYPKGTMEMEDDPVL
ncbi:(2Fe-2S)-binding protein [Streptomyces griseocarneus]|nr:(2Fe-2S)-binding protein [Streptomyces griseocarneus]